MEELTERRGTGNGGRVAPAHTPAWCLEGFLFGRWWLTVERRRQCANIAFSMLGRFRVRKEEDDRRLKTLIRAEIDPTTEGIEPAGLTAVW